MILSAVIGSIGATAVIATSDVTFADVLKPLLTLLVGGVVGFLASPFHKRRERLKRERDAKISLEAWLIDVDRAEEDLFRLDVALAKDPNAQVEVPALPGLPTEQITDALKAVDKRVGFYTLALDRQLRSLHWSLSRGDPRVDQIHEWVPALGRTKAFLQDALKEPLRRGEMFMPAAESR
jgi:hypothetical protein